MKRAKDVAALRARLAELIAAPGPPRQRGVAMWEIAEKIAAETGEPTRAIFDRGVKDAVALQVREAFE